RHRAPLLSQHPRGEELEARVLGDEDAVLEAPAAPVRALDPPGGVRRDRDPRLADDVADLPRRSADVARDLEVRRHAEVALPTGRERDLVADPGDAEGALGVAVEVAPDDIPRATVVGERVRVERALALLAAGHRDVLELDRALLRDRDLELRESPLELERVVGVEALDPDCRLRRRLGEAG